jgi:hypothetical protein
LVGRLGNTKVVKRLGFEEMDGWDRIEWNILQTELFLFVCEKWGFSKTSLFSFKSLVYD